MKYSARSEVESMVMLGKIAGMAVKGRIVELMDRWIDGASKQYSVFSVQCSVVPPSSDFDAASRRGEPAQQVAAGVGSYVATVCFHRSLCRRLGRGREGFVAVVANGQGACVVGFEFR